MSNEIINLSPILGEIIIEPNLSNYEHLITDRERILSYRSEEGKILVGVNDQFLSSLSKRIDDLSVFLLPFQSLVELIADLERQREKFMVLFNETVEIQNQHSKIHEEIANYEAEYEEGTKERDSKLKEQLSPAKKEFISQMGNKLAIALADKTSRLFYLRLTKDFEKDRAKKAALIEKKLQGGLAILEHLRTIQSLINDKVLDKLFENFVEFTEKIEDIKNYIKYIESKGNLLIDHEEFDLKDLKHKLACIMLLIQDFSSLYMRLVDIKYELIYRQEAVNLTNLIWITKAEADAEVAAQDFINTEIAYTQKKVDSLYSKILVSSTKDQLDHLQDCQENINSNIQSLFQELESVHLTGGIDYKIGNKTKSYGCSSGHSGNYIGLTRISHNFRVQKTVIPKIMVDVRNVPEHERTLELREIQEQFRRLNREAQAEKEKLVLVLYRYREIEAKIAENNISKHKEYSERDRQLNEEIRGYKDFLAKINENDFDISSELILALMGILFKNISIQPNLGIFSKRRKLLEFEMVEIHPQGVYDTFFEVLLEQGLVVKKSCGNPKIKKIHHCNLVNFIMFKELLLRTNIYGSLKTSDGRTQEKIGKLRGEDISMSLFRCVKGAMDVIVMKNLLVFRVNYDAITQKVKETEDFAVVQMQQMDYSRFANKIKGYRLKR